MTSEELRGKFLAYFKEKNHIVVPSSSLIPADSTVLFTTAGMQQFSPYLSGKADVLKDFGSRHLTSCQKCFRTGDIEEIGDDTHHTFFEMLGNWSIGQDEDGYFKEGAIDFALDFLINKLGLEQDRLHITVFKGNDDIEKDLEAIDIWKSKGISSERIYEFDAKDNFWGPVSGTGPCGPCSEIHYDRGEEFGCENCGPNCDKCKRFVEIWNLVFMEYFKNNDGEYQKLSQTNIDTGIGFERLLSIIQKKHSAYETDIFLDLIAAIERHSKKGYLEDEHSYRVIADHIRGACFLISEGIRPSNNDKGYILRRLIRRIVRHSKFIGLDLESLKEFIDSVLEKYGDIYPELKNCDILSVFKEEKDKFERTIERGLRELNKFEKITAKDAFNLYQTFGFPIEMIKEEAINKNIELDEKGFEEELIKHQEISKAGAEKKFGGVGKNAGEEEARLHTATHLLHHALREVLGEDVRQMGSNINNERLRFDFAYERKMTEEEIKEVENLVNKRIKDGFEVKKEMLSLDEALSSGALAFFREKYPEQVNVYTIINPETGEIYSKEICAGPHVESSEKFGVFKIKKETSSSAGVRRIKAIII